MKLQQSRSGETPQSIEKHVEELFAQPPLSTGLRKLADRHGSLEDPAARGRGGGVMDGRESWLSSPVAVMFLMVLLLGSFLLLVRLRKAYLFGTDGSKGEKLPPAPQRVLNSTALRQEARGRAGAGDFREAIRLLLLSLLTLISERKLVDLARNLTTREIYARLPKDQQSEGQYLEHFFHVFEEASYGGRDVGQSEFDDLDGILDRGFQHELLKRSSWQ